MRINDVDAAGAITIQNGFPCGNRNEEGRGIAQLRPFNVTDGGQIDLSKTKYIETDQRLDAYLVRPNDVIFNNTNSEELVGKTALWKRFERAVLSNHMTIVRVRDEKAANATFLALYLLYKWYKGHFKTVCRRHVNQASVSRERLCNVDFPAFSVAEQRQIAALLSAVQRAIERQERLIALTAELKKALMHKLFTEGTRGERLKQTEIGPLPESWNFAPLKQFTESFQYGTSVKCGYDVKGSPVLRIPNVINTGTLQTFLVPKPDIDEQNAIADALASVDRKARNHAVCEATLETLFRTLLHQLMTAQIRVHDLDLSGLERAAQPAGAV